MKDAYDIFTNDPGYKDYCLLEYPRNLSLVAENTTLECKAPLTPLLMYYASHWDAALVADVIEELKDPVKVDLINRIGVCASKDVYCPPEILANVTVQDGMWILQFGEKVKNITSSWDMKGGLVANFTQATELASYFMQVDLFKGFVDFGFDKNFSFSNPTSQYSRGIIAWGGPYADRNVTNLSDEEAKEAKKADDNQLKRYVVCLVHSLNLNTLLMTFLLVVSGISLITI